MKTFFIVFVLFLAFVPAARCQSLSIDGTIFSLGESEAKARTDIATARFDLLDMKDDSFALTRKKDGFPLIDIFGEIGFRGGKVFFVGREWLLNATPRDDQTVLTIFHSAVSSLLEGAEQARCTVATRTKDNSPSSGINKASQIDCAEPNYTHSLNFFVTDCSAGCSTGGVAPSISESIKQN